MNKSVGFQSGMRNSGSAEKVDSPGKRNNWTEPTELGPGLNGDIIVWNPVLDGAFEISSMGIRVDKAALERQLELSGQTVIISYFPRYQQELG